MIAGNQEDVSATTDVRSDISFLNKQKELRSIYRDFKSAIESIQNVCPDDTNEEECAPDAGIISEEIDILESEVADLQNLLLKPKIAKMKRTRAISAQIAHLREVIESMRRRADALFEPNSP